MLIPEAISVEALIIPELDEYNKNEVNVAALQVTSTEEGKVTELQDVLYLASKITSPTKQMQKFISFLGIRLAAYTEEAPI